jgi:hypothetical protein
MKINSLIAVVALMASAIVSKADYQVTFNTANDTTSNFVVDVDGTTKLDSSFLGQIYAGADAGSLVAIGSALQFGTVGGSVNSAANGFIINNIISSGTSAIAPGTAAVYQLRAWKGAATYEAALVTVGAKVGSSASTSITVQGPPSLTTPPNTSLHAGFQLSTVAVPEPATIALGLFGAAGLLIRRRK